MEARGLVNDVRGERNAKEDGIFLLVDSVNRDNALVIQREGRVIYADTSMGVGVSELMKIRKMKPTQVYRLDGILDENYVNPRVMDALKRRAMTDVPIGLFARDENFQFDVGLRNGRIIWANAYYRESHIVGYTALRLFLSSRVRDIQYSETMEPSVKIIDLPVEDVLAVFRLPEVRVVKPEEVAVRVIRSAFHRVVSGLSIEPDAWDAFVKEFLSRKGSYALASSDGRLVIIRDGRIEREEKLKVNYECPHFRVWALEFAGEYAITGKGFVLGSITLNIPTFLVHAEIEDNMEGFFFLFSGFEYDPSINSELYIVWRKPFFTFFDDLSIVDFEGMDWVVVNVDAVDRLPPAEVLSRYASRILFVGKPPIEDAPHVLPSGSSLLDVTAFLRKMASGSSKKERVDLCVEVKRLIAALRARYISWPVEIAKIRAITGVDPMQVDSCNEEELIRLREFILQNYNLETGGEQ